MRHLSVLAVVAVLAACRAEPAAEAAAPPPPAAPPAAATPPPSAAAVAVGDHPVTFAGVGNLRFGTPAADMQRAWGGELRAVGQEANARCYFMVPAWARVPAEYNLMVSEGRFARFGTESDRHAAPGGGRVGMHADALQRLYNGALQATPHAYTEGRYLSIAASGVAPSKLVFETDSAGTVTEWRVGLLPEVDYVEGCS